MIEFGGSVNGKIGKFGVGVLVGSFFIFYKFFTCTCTCIPGSTNRKKYTVV